MSVKAFQGINFHMRSPLRWCTSDPPGILFSSLSCFPPQTSTSQEVASEPLGSIPLHSGVPMPVRLIQMLIVRSYRSVRQFVCQSALVPKLNEIRRS